MRILILVQSMDNPFYEPLIKSQQETWDSIDYPNVEVLYYKPSYTNEGVNDHFLEVLHNTKPDHTFFVLMKAIRYMLRKEQWDYIIKTNNCVYLNKEKIYNLLLNKPREKYFAGYPITHDKLSEESKKNFPSDIKFLWGELLIMSRDCAVHLVNIFNKAPLKGVGAEDIIVSHLLKDYCSWDESITISIDENDPVPYAYKVRKVTLAVPPIFQNPADMEKIITSDIFIMHKIHNLITNDQTDNRERVLQKAQDQA